MPALRTRTCSTESGRGEPHDIAALWVAFFSRWQRDRCAQRHGEVLEVGGRGGRSLLADGRRHYERLEERAAQLRHGLLHPLHRDQDRAWPLHIPRSNGRRRGTERHRRPICARAEGWRARPWALPLRDGTCPANDPSQRHVSSLIIVAAAGCRLRT